MKLKKQSKKNLCFIYNCLTRLDSTVELITANLVGIASFPSTDKLSAYIAGLVEGDGSIKIPSSFRSDKGKILYPSVTIVFVEKDLPLANFLSIYKFSALHEFAQLVNGKFRTPKIEALHRLINWFNNYGKFDKIKHLSADESSVTSNSWLAGFSDCDSNFLISFSTSNLGIAKNIRLTYRLSQRQEFHRTSSTGISYLPLLSTVATAFYTKFTSYERKRLKTKTNSTYTEKGYLVTVSTLASRIALINYFLEFPLLSSKHLDYLNWVEA